ncbi:MAG: hypothetical protein DHS80DRAFT_13992 [Piptocephalis tieghemiana]|nr:MAG: hypothetical protein DHS80DRAFT_13992 [Piptocephalis tieghemiana]
MEIKEKGEGEEEEGIRIRGFHLLPRIESLTKKYHILREPQTWRDLCVKFKKCAEQAESEGAPPPIIVICGAKGMGKSTLGRYLLNSLLRSYNQVGYLDTDMGQPEFTTPGQISLHTLFSPILGPPFTHQNIPERSIYWGETSPKDLPDAYLHGINQLIQHYRKEMALFSHPSKGTQRFTSRGTPLIINAQGWVRGLGYDLLMAMLHAVQPTHLCHLISSPKGIAQRNNGIELPPGPWETMTLITVMDDAVTLPSWARWSSADRRTLSYLASMYQSPLNQWTLPIPGSEGILTAREPWVVPWSALHIWVSGVEVPTSQLLYALNASLWTCVGLGLIRGIDPVNHTFHILAPSLPPSMVRRVRGLVRGPVEGLPWCFGPVRHGRGGCVDAEGRRTPYVSGRGQEGLGTGVRRVRRNLMRKRLEGHVEGKSGV